MSPLVLDIIAAVQRAIAESGIEMDEATQWRPDDLREREQEEATELEPAAPKMSVSPMRDGVKR